MSESIRDSNVSKSNSISESKSTSESISNNDESKINSDSEANSASGAKSHSTLNTGSNDSEPINELPETFATNSTLGNIIPNIMELLGASMLLKKNKKKNK